MKIEISISQLRIQSNININKSLEISKIIKFSLIKNISKNFIGVKFPSGEAINRVTKSNIKDTYNKIKRPEPKTYFKY